MNRRIAREAKQAAAKADLVHKLLQQGGPCVTADDVDALVVRFRNEDTVLLNALQDQIRYQKMVLGQKVDLRLSGSIEELSQFASASQEWLPDDDEPLQLEDDPL